MKATAYVGPLYDRSVEPDSPHSAATDLAYRQKTDGLVWRCSGSTRSWVWPFREDFTHTLGPVAPPQAVVSTLDSWVNFQFPANSTSLGMPWKFTEDFENILVMTRVVCNSDVSIAVKVNVETLVDAVATTQGRPPTGYCRTAIDPEGMSWQMYSASGGKNYCEGVWWSWIETPTMPANRRVALVPYVKAPSVHQRDVRWDVSGTADVFLTAMVAMDVPPKANAGW